jgi:hypothetical protein
MTDDPVLVKLKKDTRKTVDVTFHLKVPKDWTIEQIIKQVKERLFSADGKTIHVV